MTTSEPITAALMEEFSDDAAGIRVIANRLRDASTKGELGTIIAKEVRTFSLFELQVIGGRLNNEIEKLPSPYRERIRPFFIDQLFGKHHQLLADFHAGVFSQMGIEFQDRPTFDAFCDMLPSGCFAWDDWGSERNPYFRHPRNRLFYYLIAAYTMFVLDEPGHPVGMPFPGGFTVEKRNYQFYCLIRDKEKEVCYSICNFCPAKQSEENK